MDAFTLAMSYGIKKISIKKVILTSIIVGIFHFFMPLIGDKIGVNLFEYTFIKPKFIMFLVFLILSFDMFLSFFKKKEEINHLSMLGTILFAFSVSFDSLTVGLGIRYLYNNIILSVSIFCVISAVFTLFGFFFGKKLSKSIGNYSFLFGSIILFLYSIGILTN